MITEHTEQVLIYKWCKAKRIPMYAVPQGIYLPVPKFIPVKYQNILKKCVQKVMSKMKSEGAFQKGISDIVVPIANKKYGHLYIELKIKGNYATKEQKEFLARVNKNGCFGAVCYGAEDAIKTIEDYLGNRL